MTTEAEQLRAYVLLHGWQARNVEMSGACIFLPSAGVLRCPFSFKWHTEMSLSDVCTAVDAIAVHEKRLPSQVWEDLPVAYELMREQC